MVAVAVSLVTAGLFGCVVSQAWPGPDGATDSGDWCGGSLGSDWVCGKQGSARAGSASLRSGGVRRIRPNTVVWAERGSAARVSLRNQARCTIGGGESASEVISRPRIGILLRQRLGDSACTTPQRQIAIELCAVDDCIALLRAEGTALASILSPEATASLTESFYRRIRIVSCSGYVSVSAGGQVAAGGARGRNRFVIEVVESSSRTEDETTTETPDGGTTTESVSSASSSVTVKEIGELPGRGPCAASFVREGERSVEG